MPRSLEGRTGCMSETWLTTATTRTWRSLCLEVGDWDLAELAICEQHKLECYSEGLKESLGSPTGRIIKRCVGDEPSGACNSLTAAGSDGYWTLDVAQGRRLTGWTV